MGTFHIIPHALQDSRKQTYKLRNAPLSSARRSTPPRLRTRGTRPRTTRAAPVPRIPPLLLPLCTVAISLWPAASRGLPGPTSARPVNRLFCFLKKLSGVRKLTTFYLVKNDHRWVTLIPLKMIRPHLRQLQDARKAHSKVAAS